MALAPPPDVAVRVERVGRRAAAPTACGGRRGGGLVAVGAVGGAVVLGGADPESAGNVAVDPGSPTGSFVLTRPDGSTYEMADLTLIVRRPAGGRATTPTRAGRSGSG